MIKIIAASLLLVASPGSTQGQLVVDSASVSFKIRNAGLMVNGTFTGFVAQLNFNPKRPESSQITASVDAASVNTGIRIRNNHLRRSDYFYVEAFPRITMKSLDFQKKGEGQFLGDFILSIKGKEGRVSVPFSFQKEGASYIFRGSFRIDRRDYDIGGKSFLLSDDVSVTILVRAREE